MDGLCRVVHGCTRAAKAMVQTRALGRELRFAGPENRVGYLTKPRFRLFNCVQWYNSLN